MHALPVHLSERVVKFKVSPNKDSWMMDNDNGDASEQQIVQTERIMQVAFNFMASDSIQSCLAFSLAEASTAAIPELHEPSFVHDPSHGPLVDVVQHPDLFLSR